MNESNMTLKEFSDRLSSGDPTPGGGGASALVGCIGVALGNMVAHLTVGRKKYAAVQDEMEDVIRRSAILQDELLELISKDARMFLPLSKAYSLPRNTQEEIEAREMVMGQALNDACQVPLEIMEKMCLAVDLVETVARKGTANAMSDAGDAAAFCSAALKSAALNVFINTKLMKDRDMAEEYDRRARAMLDQYVSAADGIYELVRKKLTGRPAGPTA